MGTDLGAHPAAGGQELEGVMQGASSPSNGSRDDWSCGTRPLPETSPWEGDGCTWFKCTRYHTNRSAHRGSLTPAPPHTSDEGRVVPASRGREPTRGPEPLRRPDPTPVSRSYIHGLRGPGSAPTSMRRGHLGARQSRPREPGLPELRPGRAGSDRVRPRQSLAYRQHQAERVGRVRAPSCRQPRSRPRRMWSMNHER